METAIAGAAFSGDECVMKGFVGAQLDNVVAEVARETVEVTRLVVASIAHKDVSNVSRKILVEGYCTLLIGGR